MTWLCDHYGIVSLQNDPFQRLLLVTSPTIGEKKITSEVWFTMGWVGGVEQVSKVGGCKMLQLTCLHQAKMTMEHPSFEDGQSFFWYLFGFLLLPSSGGLHFEPI